MLEENRIFQNSEQNEKKGFPFYLVLIYMFFEYARPQSFIPAIGAIRPAFITLLLLTIVIISRRAFYVIKVREIKLFITLLVLMSLHVFIATNNFWAFQVMWGLTAQLIIFAGILLFVDNLPKLESYINLWILINVAGAFVGIAHGGIVPNSGFMQDENDFALVMDMAIPFAYFMMIETKSNWKRIIYASAIVVYLVAVVVSFSRGGFVGFVAVGAYIWYKTPRKVYSTLAILLLAGTLYLVASNQYWKEVMSIEDENIESGTGAERWYYWECGWRMFLDNKLIGVGQGNFPWRIHNYEPPEGFEGRSHSGRPAHSIYITLISELGLAGTILFLALLWVLIRNKKMYKLLRNQIDYGDLDDEAYDYFNKKLRQLHLISISINGGIVGYLITGIFLSVLYYPHLWHLIGLSSVVNLQLQNLYDELDAELESLSDQNPIEY